jgi:ABC-type glycerol-3-phosphate transport system substrate-binding protein
MTDNLTPWAKRRLDRRRLFEIGAAGVGATIVAACGPPSVSAPTQAPAAAPTTAPAAAAPTTAPAAAPTATTAAAAAATPAATTAAAPTATTAAAAAPAANTGATTGQPVTIVFNTWWQPLQDAFVVLTKEFQDANPGVTVNTQFGGNDYTTKMEAGIVAGGFGDAATSDNGVQTKYMSAGQHYDMTDLLKQDNINLRANYALGGIEIWGGKVLNLPMDNDDRAVYYN